MYKKYFGLDFKPFDITPNPDLLFSSQTHLKAWRYLSHGIKEKHGFILLTGEVGSGKTTLIKQLIRKLRFKSPTALVFNTQVDNEQLLAMINGEFGLEAAARDKVSLLKELNDFLVAEYSKSSLPVLIIDEAQNLTPENLEEIRLLSNLEAESSKLLQIILVGQPELRDSIERPDLLQLRQRIGFRCHLASLSSNENYIFYRLKKAGNRDAVSFTPEALALIYQYSGGIPRLINFCCDFILLAAFAEETREISTEMAREVIEGLAETSSTQEAAPLQLIDRRRWLCPSQNWSVNWTLSKDCLAISPIQVNLNQKY
jgi:putative secretion ATPase (PEP-CTERM system associated)